MPALHIAAQCLANIAAGGDPPADSVWQATVPAAWHHLLTAKAGSSTPVYLLGSHSLLGRHCMYNSNHVKTAERHGRLDIHHRIVPAGAVAEVAARTIATCLRSLPTAKAQLLCSAEGADIVRSLMTEEVRGCDATAIC